MLWSDENAFGEVSPERLKLLETSQAVQTMVAFSLTSASSPGHTWGMRFSLRTPTSTQVASACRFSLRDVFWLTLVGQAFGPFKDEDRWLIYGVGLGCPMLLVVGLIVGIVWMLRRFR